MKIRFRLAGAGCVLLLSTLTACAALTPATNDPAPTTTAATTTTTAVRRTTTALPSVGYIHRAASVRSGAGLSYKAIGGVQLGEQITIVGKQGDWYEIQFTATETGFVSGQFVRFTPYDPDATTTTAAETTTTAETTSTGVDE